MSVKHTSKLLVFMFGKLCEVCMIGSGCVMLQFGFSDSQIDAALACVATLGLVYVLLLSS